MSTRSRRLSTSAADPVIAVRGARQHNLKGLDLDFPLGKLTVVTGPSGSGKSSLAFHTLYAEGQRRYVETFSPYVRQFFDRMDKPAVDRIDGIPPAIAIEQKNNVRTTRSTVGTLTEINEYLKLLFARLAKGYDPLTGEEIRPDTAESAAAWVKKECKGGKLLALFPVSVPASMTPAEVFALLKQQGYLRVLIYGELFRTDEPEGYARQALPAEVFVVQDRVTATQTSRLFEALETAFHHGKGHCAIAVEDQEIEVRRRFSANWTNPDTGYALRPPSAALFSFNNPLGACPKCRGFGRIIGIDLEKSVPDSSLSLREGAIKPFQGERGEECQRDLLKCCKVHGVDPDVPWEDLSAAAREWIYYGDRITDDSWAGLTDLERSERLWNAGKWYGVKGFFDWLESKAYKMHVRVFLSRYRSYTACPACRGRRLQPEALCFRIDDKTLPDLWQLPVARLLPWMEKECPPEKQDPSLALVCREVISRLRYLDEVGLGYLTLDRQTRTLSGGEIERVNLTTCLGASLTSTLFVLDEPTVGLHARDIDRLIGIMHGLRDKGNTLVVVEHEEAVMRAADHIVDIGPGSGEFGGELVFQGRADAVVKSKTGTLPWLRGEKSIMLPKKRRTGKTRQIEITGASRHNLKRVDFALPLRRFVCLTGVSGSGKSTLAHDVLYRNLARKFGREMEDEAAPIKDLKGSEELADVRLVDQSPLTRTPRSTPAVYTGAFDAIRIIFTETEEARAQQLKPGFFSFNSGAGRCDRCAGNGFEKVEMQFLSDLYVTCPDCNGSRYRPSALEIKVEGKSIADMLALTVEESLKFLRHLASTSDHKKVVSAAKQAAQLLEPLAEVGLDYLRLGQPLNTLSGGESQRLKLCELLQQVSSGPSEKETALLILDEPTTGLHFSDIEKLLGVFQRLVDAGHSLLVIEHNLDVIKCADWIIDLGPEAGEHGGKIVATGTPEEIVKANTVTGQFLASILGGGRKAKTKEPAIKVSHGVEAIELRGAREHNLKNISLDIPREKFVVISGLSGSGKSTLAFDILFAEGQRRFLDSMSVYARQFAEQLEKPEIDHLAGLPPTVAIEQRVSQGGGKSTVATVTELWNFIRLLYSKLGTPYCPDCHVPVAKQSLASIETTVRRHLAKGAVSVLAPVIRARKGFHTEVAEWAGKQGFARLLVDKKFRDVEGFTRLERFKEHDIDVVVADLKKGAKDLPAIIERALGIGKGSLRLYTADKKFVLLSAEQNCPSCGKSYEDLDPRLFSFHSPHGWCVGCRGHGRVPKRRQRIDTSRFDSVLEAELDADRAIDRMEDEELVTCPDCDGTRLRPFARTVELHGTPIAALGHMAIGEAGKHFSAVHFKEEREALIARDILPEINQRLSFLQQVGLGYLQLDRSARTLSGGEAQRIRLAAQLGSNLRGVLYVLDEPTIGLHPRDNGALLETLTALRDKGNSLLVVEHDEETIERADWVIDLGPGAGRLGGEIIAQGTPEQVKKQTGSVTGKALAERLVHPIRGERREIPAIVAKNGWLRVDGCRANNLRKVDLKIPLGRLTVLTGISGSGKSSLLRGCLMPAAEAAVSKARASKSATRPWSKTSGFESIAQTYVVDQSPIGKTSRSCPATYVKVFDDIRKLFAQIPEARMRGYDASRFSFNTEGGRCEDCKGNGRVKLEMDFLPPTWVPCETCHQERYNPATLEVTYREHSIGAVLKMTIEDAAEFFAAQPRIATPLKLLAATGLGYLQLGQPSPTLSGGEAQRIKLVTELVRGRLTPDALKRARLEKRNLYMIEEPTVGLHLEDVKRLIDVLHRLVDEGHTVVVIEHHMAVAAEADYVIDLGPEAGESGGIIVAEGAPEQVAKSKTSRTAPFLREALAVKAEPAKKPGKSLKSAR